ncbi:UNVERIFIED_CONTAM: diguanylate cyclase [Aeromonas hydrophila]
MKPIVIFVLLQGLSSTFTWASREPLLEPQLTEELRRLELGMHPDRVFRLRVIALAANYDTYSPEIQGRISRLQCWAMSADKDSEFRKVVDFATNKLINARERDDRITEAGLLACRGFHQQLLRNMEEAASDYAQSLLLARALGDKELEANIINLRGEMLAYQGELAAGMQELIEAHRRYDALGLKNKAREVLTKIANTYRRMGLYKQAEDYFKVLEKEFHEVGDQEHQINILAQLSLLYSDMGQYKRATSLMDRVEKYYQQQQQDSLLAWVKIEKANAMLQLGQVKLANVELQQAKTILHREESDSVTYGHWLLAMGKVLGIKGEIEKALDNLEQAELIFTKEKNQRLLIKVYESKSNLYEGAKNTSEALKNLKLYIYTKMKMDKGIIEQRALHINFELDLSRKELAYQKLKTQQIQRDAELNSLSQRQYYEYFIFGIVAFFGMVAIYQRRRLNQLRHRLMPDELTGVYNSHQIQVLGERWFEQARTDGKSFSILSIEVDHLDEINDRLGGLIGKQVLAEVAKNITAQLRSVDRIGRSGVETFLVLLSDTRINEAAEHAERIRHVVSLLKTNGVLEESSISASIGFSQMNPSDDSISELVQRADLAMSRAKQSGGNQVIQAN